MLIHKRLMQLGLMVAAVLGIGLMPMLAGSAANAAGCAENIENATENPGTPSPYTPQARFICP